MCDASAEGAGSKYTGIDTEYIQHAIDEQELTVCAEHRVEQLQVEPWSQGQADAHVAGVLVEADSNLDGYSRCQVLLLHSVLRAGAVFLVLCAQCCCCVLPTWQSTSSKREKHSQ